MTRFLLFVAFIAALAAGLVGAAVKSTPALPFYDSADLTPHWTRSSSHHIADFSLVTQEGAPLTRADVTSKVHVASFIFTRCAGICPAMVTQLSKVQAAIGNREAILVSYSVTPQDDTPEHLAAFGQLRGIDPQRWKLVTGDAEQIYGLARTSYFGEGGDRPVPAHGEGAAGRSRWAPARRVQRHDPTRRREVDRRPERATRSRALDLLIT